MSITASPVWCLPFTGLVLHWFKPWNAFDQNHYNTKKIESRYQRTVSVVSRGGCKRVWRSPGEVKGHWSCVTGGWALRCGRPVSCQLCERSRSERPPVYEAISHASLLPMTPALPQPHPLATPHTPPYPAHPWGWALGKAVRRGGLMIGRECHCWGGGVHSAAVRPVWLFGGIGGIWPVLILNIWTYCSDKKHMAILFWQET